MRLQRGQARKWGWEKPCCTGWARAGLRLVSQTLQLRQSLNCSWVAWSHTNVELQQCHGAATSPPRPAQKQEEICPPEHFNKTWSGSCCPMTHFVCMLGARSEKYLLSEGGGWKKTVHISRWGQAKFYLPLARLSCRKAFRLDLKLFWVKRKAAIDVKQNMWVKVIGMFLVKKKMMQKPTYIYMYICAVSSLKASVSS